jgi:hypothetical protein
LFGYFGHSIDNTVPVLPEAFAQKKYQSSFKGKMIDLWHSVVISCDTIPFSCAKTCLAFQIVLLLNLSSKVGLKLGTLGIFSEI